MSIGIGVDSPMQTDAGNQARRQSHILQPAFDEVAEQGAGDQLFVVAGQVEMREIVHDTTIAARLRRGRPAPESGLLMSLAGRCILPRTTARARLAATGATTRPGPA